MTLHFLEMEKIMEVLGSYIRGEGFSTLAAVFPVLADRGSEVASTGPGTLLHGYDVPVEGVHDLIEVVHSDARESTGEMGFQAMCTI